MIILILVTLFPAVLWLSYFYLEDSLETEPKILIAKMFCAGALAIIPAAFLESLTIWGSDRTLMTVGIAPVIEECIKFGVVFIWIYHDKEFDEPMDGIVYAASVALGFATVENVFYFYQSPAYVEMIKNINSSPFYFLYLLRSLLSMPGHAIDSAMFGFALGMAKFADKKHGISLIAKGLGLAIVFHAAFNALLDLGMLIYLIFFGVPFAWRLLNKKIVLAIIASPFATPQLQDKLTRKLQKRDAK
jgi:RsiW-degrading membrane proteinase PrsW (M82 family)